MEQRIIRIPVHRTSLIMAVAAAIFGLVAVVLMAPFMITTMHMMSGNDNAFSPMMATGAGLGMMVVFMPVMYFIFGYIGTAIFLFVFNFVAGRMGGVPIEFGDAQANG